MTTLFTDSNSFIFHREKHMDFQRLMLKKTIENYLRNSRRIEKPFVKGRGISRKGRTPKIIQLTLKVKYIDNMSIMMNIIQM